MKQLKYSMCQQVLFNMTEQLFHSDLLSGVWSPQRISDGEPLALIGTFGEKSPGWVAKGKLGTIQKPLWFTSKRDVVLLGIRSWEPNLVQRLGAGDCIHSHGLQSETTCGHYHVGLPSAAESYPLTGVWFYTYFHILQAAVVVLAFSLVMVRFENANTKSRYGHVATRDVRD